MRGPLARAAIAVLLLRLVVACAPERGTPVHRVTLLHIADLHSHLFPGRLRVNAFEATSGLGEEGTVAEVGGAARLFTAVARERRTAEVAFLLDAGDLFEGTPVFDAFGGLPELAIRSALGVEAAAAGNHDLDAGLSALRSRPLSPPVLAANLTAQYPDLLVQDTVLQSRGVRVGVVGLGRSPDAAPDLDAAARAVNVAVARLGPEVDVMVVLSHLGTDADVALVPRTSGVDVVLGGHTHDVVSPAEVVQDCGPALAEATGCTARGVSVFHPGAYGRYLGRVDVELRAREDGGRGVAVTGSRLLPMNAAVEESPEIVQQLQPYASALETAGLSAPVAWIPEDVSHVAVSGGDSALGNLLTQALRTLTQADVSIVNTTALRADLLAGVATRTDLFEAMPFADALVGRLMGGAELASAFGRIARASCGRGRQSQVQVDGARVTFRCDGGGSATVAIGGAPLDPGRTYRVATSDFLAQPDGWLAGPLAALPALGTIPQAFEAYVRGRPRCNPPEDAGPGLPCLGPESGALADGRISWGK